MSLKYAICITLILMVAIVSLAMNRAQFGTLTNNVQGNVNLFNAEASTFIAPNIIACGGCSGGGIGPAS